MADDEVKIKFGVDSSAMGQGLNSIKGAVSKWTDSFKGEGNGFFGQSRGELRKLTNELQESFPAVGTAAKLMLNPIGGALTLGIGLFTFFKDKLDKWNEEMDRQSYELAKPSFRGEIDAKKKALGEAAERAAEYADKLSKAVDQEERQEKAFAANIDLINRKRKAVDELQRMENAAQLAAIDRQQKSGALTPDQAEQKKGQLEAQQRKDELNILKNNQDADLRRRGAEVSRLGDARDAAGGKAGADAAKFTDLDKKNQERVARYTQQQQELAEAQRRYDATPEDRNATYDFKTGKRTDPKFLAREALYSAQDALNKTQGELTPGSSQQSALAQARRDADTSQAQHLELTKKAQAAQDDFVQTGNIYGANVDAKTAQNKEADKLYNQAHPVDISKATPEQLKGLGRDVGNTRRAFERDAPGVNALTAAWVGQHGWTPPTGTDASSVAVAHEVLAILKDYHENGLTVKGAP